MNAKELTTTIETHLKNLAALVDNAARSDAIKLFFETCGRFHNYSWGNQMLIFFSNPQATRVAGYKTWNKFNRFVRRGEHGIPILAPCIYREIPDDDTSPKVVKGFRVVYVFDISQTDGEPLPEPPDWKSPAHSEKLQAQLLQFAQTHGINVEIKEQRGECLGTSNGKGLITLAPNAGTSTLVHEIAHELMHPRTEHLPRQIQELEAEAVAYIVCAHFNLQSSAPNYLALWEADSKVINDRMTRIQSTAASILTAIEDQKESE
jgi:hypothetical protein